MRVTVLYFGPVRELLGASEEAIVLADGPPAPTIGVLVAELARRHPGLEPKLGFLRFARNEAMAGLSEPIGQGDVVALIPPFAGG